MHRLTYILCALLFGLIPVHAQVARDLAGKLKSDADIDTVAYSIVSFFDYELEAERQALADAAMVLVDPTRRLKAFAAIALADPKSPALQQRLAELISDRKNQHAARLIRLSALCSEPTPELQQALLQALKRGDVDERLEAAQALGRLPFTGAAVLDGLEDNLDERDDLVLAQVARAYARCGPEEARIEKLRERVASAKGTKLQGAILVLGNLGDRQSLAALVPLAEKKATVAEAYWAIGQICAHHQIDLLSVLDLFGVEDLKDPATVDQVLSLLAVGVPSAGDDLQLQRIRELVASKSWSQNALALEAFLRLGRGRVGSLKLRETPDDPRWYAFSLDFNSAANAKLKLAPEHLTAPADLWWRIELQLEDHWEAEHSLAEELRSELAHKFSSVGTGRLLHARFIGDRAQEEKNWPADSGAALATKKDSAWLALLPIIHSDPALELNPVLKPMIEHVGFEDQLILDCGRAYVGHSTDRFDAARRALYRFIVLSLNQGLASDLRKDLPEFAALRIHEIYRRSTWLLDSSARRLAVIGALEGQPLVAPRILPLVTEWLEFEADPNNCVRLQAVLIDAGLAALDSARVLKTLPAAASDLVGLMHRDLLTTLMPSVTDFRDRLVQASKAVGTRQSSLDAVHAATQFSAVLRSTDRLVLSGLILEMHPLPLGAQVLSEHVDILPRVAPKLLDDLLSRWSNNRPPLNNLETDLLRHLALKTPERLLSLDLEDGPYRLMVLESLLLAGPMEAEALETLGRNLRSINQPELARRLIDAGADAKRVTDLFKSGSQPISVLYDELAEQGDAASLALLFPMLEEFYLSAVSDAPIDLARLTLLAKAGRRALAAGNASWTEFMLSKFKEDLPPHLQTPILWAIPQGHVGAEEIDNYRRQLLLEGGDVELQAIAALVVARANLEADSEAIEAALLSDYGIVAEAACAGLERAATPIDSLAPLICDNARAEGDELAIAALEALAKVEVLPEGARQVVLVNLEAKSPIRRVLAARLMPKLQSFTVAEIDSISRRLIELYQLGDEELVLALARMERPDPRLRRRLEVGCFAARKSMRVACSAALAEMFLDRFEQRAGAALNELLQYQPDPINRSLRPIDQMLALARGVNTGSGPRWASPAPRNGSVEGLLLSLGQKDYRQDLMAPEEEVARFVMNYLEGRETIAADLLVDLERLALIWTDEALAQRAQALVAKHRTKR